MGAEQTVSRVRSGRTRRHAEHTCPADLPISDNREQSITCQTLLWSKMSWFSPVTLADELSVCAGVRKACAEEAVDAYCFAPTPPPCPTGRGRLPCLGRPGRVEVGASPAGEPRRR